MYLKIMLLIVTFTTVVFNAPGKLIPPRTITGNIQSVQWCDEVIFDAQEGWKSSACYNIKLTNTIIVWTDPQESFVDPGSIGEYPEFIININRKGDTSLNPESEPLLAISGDSIKIVGYSVIQDEFRQTYTVDSISLYKKSLVVSPLRPAHIRNLKSHNFRYVTIGAQLPQMLNKSANFSLNGRMCVYRDGQASSVKLLLHR